MHLTPVLALALALPTDALACGGFFCNQEFPVDQAAEQIVFGVDDGTVEAHVTITYQGESDDFAWVVPVPTQPELFTSGDALFSTLKARTEPQFYLYWTDTGICDWSVGWGAEYDLAAADDSDGESGGVSVVAEEQVGPYQTVTLQATTTDELLTWLQGAGYDIPSDLGPVLAPYVADGQYFVALKLLADKDTGDLVPLGMRYPGTGASIPIQLTSIAATPDMRLEVYVLGDQRAVPDNYLHVKINEASINWFDGGSNYEEVITMAADEAGGHAFATDFSGSTANLRGSFWNDGLVDLDALATAGSAEQWVNMITGMGIPASAAMLALFQDLIPFPQALADQGVSPGNFYDCLSCWPEYVPTDFDAAAATAAFETRIVAGLKAAEDLVGRHDHISRLTSSLDAVEMTVDPLFVFNGDLPQEVSNIHEAELQHNCGMGEGYDGAERELILSDGRHYRLPSRNWVDRHGESDFELLGELRYPAAIVIEDYGASGQGEVLFDYTEDAAREARQFRRAGCACTTAPAASGFVPWLLLGGLLVRRRRS